MRYVGADLHKKSITFCVVEIVGSKVRVCERTRLRCDQVDRIEKFLAAQGRFQLVVESTIGYEWFAELADKHADRVVLAHAGKLRVIAESTCKTDKVDAYVLAEFLAKDMIPEAWRPTGRVRQHRTLLRRRCKVQSRITSIKNSMRGLLTRYNADRRDLFTKAGIEQALKTKLLGEDRWVLEDLQEELDQQEKRLGKIDERLLEFACQAPAREAEARAILDTMPQTGVITVETVLAELGDWRRFHNAAAVASYAGLEPKVRESDGRRKELGLTKAGSPLLRWIMIQLAHRIKRRSARWERIYAPLEKRIGGKKATCAVARRLLLVMYAMLRDGRAYQMPAVA